MTLFTWCKKCQFYIPVPSSGASRPDVEDELGYTFELVCPECHLREDYDAAGVKAKATHMPLFILFGATLLLSVIIMLLTQISFPLPSVRYCLYCCGY